MADVNPGVEGLKRHRELLKERMDPDFGLLGKLYANGTLSNENQSRIKAQVTVNDRNHLLLDCIIDAGKYHELAEALRESHQTHIVNYLTGNGVYSSDFGDDWPLMERETRILRENQEHLIDLIDPSALINYLFAENVLNGRQKEFISSKSTSHEKNEALLEMIRRAALSDYQKLILGLEESNQTHIAQTLQPGAAIARLHVDLDETSGNIDDLEDKISTSIARMLNGVPVELSRRILELSHAKIIASRRGHSVVLYVSCKSLDVLVQLEYSVNSGSLRIVLEELFNSLLQGATRTRVKRVRIYSEEYVKCKEFLRALEQELLVTGMGTTVKDIPSELLEIILQKSCLLGMLKDKVLVLRGNRWNRGKDSETITKLSSVDYQWFQVMIQRRFKNRIWRHLTEYYQKVRRTAAIIRSNEAYLMLHIQSKDLIDRLRSADCLTDVQLRQTKRSRAKLKGSGDINREESERQAEGQGLLRFIRTLDDARYSSFITCLKQTKQINVARVVKNGGAVVAATVLKRRDSEGGKEESSLLESVDEVRDRTRRRSLHTDRMVNRLKKINLEILDFTADKHTLVWIWCQSQESLERLLKLDATSTLFDESVSQKDLPQTVERPKIFISRDVFRKELAFTEVRVSLASRLDIRDEMNVMGVAFLRNRIYVLCLSNSSPECNSIQVFDGCNAFCLLDEFEVNEIRDPWDMGSSHSDNCLYVSDFKETNRIFKITAGDHRVSTWLSHFDGKFTMSVSGNGQLLVVIRSQYRLEIYGPDAQLCLSIPLPMDIREPRHALETSDGNFLIIYEWRENDGSRRMWVISEMTRDGQMDVRRFMPEDELQQLRNPHHLSLGPDDHVIVADYGGNGRVLLLDSDLVWNRVLIPTNDEKEEKFLWPWRLSFNEARKVLVVGCVGDRKVNVYTLDRKYKFYCSRDLF